MAAPHPSSPVSVAEFNGNQDPIEHLWLEHPLLDRRICYDLVWTWERLDWMLASRLNDPRFVILTMDLVRNMIDGTSPAVVRSLFVDLVTGHNMGLESWFAQFGVESRADRPLNRYEQLLRDVLGSWSDSDDIDSR